jgi:ABC-type nitrate/sulfonate/bicarbonate transport system permease component
MAGVQHEFSLLADIVGASRWHMIKKIKFRAAMPHIGGGIKIAVQQSIVGAIIAEFIATGSGLGFLILESGNRNRMGLMFGVLILLMIVASSFYKIISVLVDKTTVTQH